MPCWGAHTWEMLCHTRGYIGHCMESGGHGMDKAPHVLGSSTAGSVPKGSGGPERLRESMVGYNLPTRQLTSPPKSFY